MNLHVKNCCLSVRKLKINHNLLKSSFHTTTISNGIRNPRRWSIPNQRGQFEHHRLPKSILEKEFDYPVWRDTLLKRWPGYWFGRRFVYVREMEPELIVPHDLDGFKLKPYVSYRTPDIYQAEFTARDLFNSTYADEIIDKFKSGQQIDVQVNEDDIEKARIKAEQTGADLFIGDHSDDGIQS